MCQASDMVVNFMIKLPVDLSNVPPYIIKVRKLIIVKQHPNSTHDISTLLPQDKKKEQRRSKQFWKLSLVT